MNWTQYLTAEQLNNYNQQRSTAGNDAWAVDKTYKEIADKNKAAQEQKSAEQQEIEDWVSKLRAAGYNIEKVESAAPQVATKETTLAAKAGVPEETRPTETAPKVDNVAGSQSNPLPNSIKKQAEAKEGQWIQTKKGPYQLTANDIAWAKKQLTSRPSTATTDATNTSKPIVQSPSKVVDSFSDANAMSAAASELNRRVGNRDYTNENEGKLLAQKAALLKQLYQVQAALNKARK